MQQREHEDTVEKKALLTFISSTTRAPSRKNENQVLATGRVGIMRRITRACLMRTKVHSARVLCRLNGDRTQVASAFPNENAKKKSLAQNQHQPGDERPMSHHHQHPPFRPLFPRRQAFQETCRKHQLEMFVILASRLKLTRKLRPVIQNFVPTVWTIIHSFSESGG